MADLIPFDALPPDGAVIVFDRAPLGSYCRTGEAYRVEWVSGRKKSPRPYDLRFESIETGCATYDRPYVVADAAWHLA